MAMGGIIFVDDVDIENSGEDESDDGALTEPTLPGALPDLLHRGGTSQGDDILSGTAEGDSLAGGGGNDQINGYDGDDLLDGGSGGDHLYGGDGADTVVGGDGSDLMHGEAGDLSLIHI